MDHKEFFEAIRGIKLGITRNNMKIMMEADTSKDGLISYQEFVPVCLQVWDGFHSESLNECRKDNPTCVDRIWYLHGLLFLIRYVYVSLIVNLLMFKHVLKTDSFRASLKGASPAGTGASLGRGEHVDVQHEAEQPQVHGEFFSGLCMYVDDVEQGGA